MRGVRESGRPELVEDAEGVSACRRAAGNQASTIARFRSSASRTKRGTLMTLTR
jgi:hypothetical protein